VCVFVCVCVCICCACTCVCWKRGVVAYRQHAKELCHAADICIYIYAYIGSTPKSYAVLPIYAYIYICIYRQHGKELCHAADICIYKQTCVCIYTETCILRSSGMLPIYAYANASVHIYGVSSAPPVYTCIYKHAYIRSRIHTEFWHAADMPQLQMYAYIRMYAYIYIHTYIHTYIYVQVGLFGVELLHIYIYICVYVYMCICVYI
jgi:hypothetical protein